MKKQICTRCIMDSDGDPLIVFEKDGTCNYCNYALGRMDEVYFPNEKGEKKLQEMITRLKKERINQEYDCIMGISGGLDSAYLAYLGAKKWGLRILGVHIDDGFDSPIAINNIANLSKNCGIKMITIKPNRDQFMDLTRSFMLAGVPGVCNPQDNILVAELFHIAEKYKIKDFLSGTNFALESILPNSGGHFYGDSVNIKDIHKHFGTTPINDLRFVTLFDRYFKYKYIVKQRYIRPLDWIDYNRDRAIAELKSIGFDYYEGKHYESILTRFVQVYYLPKKFNVDIRKSHISSLIVSGQITRDEALKEMQKPLYQEENIQKDIDLILSNLKLSKEEFDKIMNEKPRNHSDFKFSKLVKFSALAKKFRKYLSD